MNDTQTLLMKKVGSNFDTEHLVLFCRDDWLGIVALCDKVLSQLEDAVEKEAFRLSVMVLLARAYAMEQLGEYLSAMDSLDAAHGHSLRAGLDDYDIGSLAIKRAALAERLGDIDKAAGLVADTIKHCCQTGKQPVLATFMFQFTAKAEDEGRLFSIYMKAWRLLSQG